MAKKITEKTVKYTIEVDEREMELIRKGLSLIYDFGDTDDWDEARSLRNELLEEF